MSHLLDFVLTPDHKMDMDLDVDSILPEEMKNIFDNSDLISSEFFDSVFSMEKQNLGLSADFNQDMESDDCSSLVGQSMFTEQNTTNDLLIQDSVPDNITLCKTESDSKHGENVLSVLEQNVQHSINEILGVTSSKTINFVKPVLNGNTKKLIVTQPVIHAKKGIQDMKKTQLLRIQSVQGNGKSLLLPVNVKSMKKFRIITASDLKVNSIKGLPASCTKNLKHIDSSPLFSETFDDDYREATYTNGRYPPLHLTAEEKRLLMKEGISLPSHYPLSKHDEKELKRIRRKIRNKVSAQDSRKRKKEYVDQLEEKAKKTDVENDILKKRVKILNRENTRLYEQLKKLQDVLFSTSNKATPTTCLMIVLFSTLLVSLPNLRTPAEMTDLEMADQESVAARRVLLFDPKVREELGTVEEFLVSKKDESEVHFEAEDKENGTSAFINFLGDLSKKYETLIRLNCTEILEGRSLQDFCKKHENDFKQALENLQSFIDKRSQDEKKFIEPDISDNEEEILNRYHNAYLLDDDDPPTKQYA